MNPFEQRMVTCLEAGGEPTPTHFGGMGALLAAVCDISLSPLMPEFLRMSIPLLADPQWSTTATEFVCRCVEGATDDFVWIEVVDLLDDARPLPSIVTERCFARFLAIAGDRALRPMARAAGLDGALRWAADDRRRQLRLAVALLEVTADDDATFLARAAKIMGVAYSHWREQGLLDNLLKLSGTDGAADEAAFELGMAKLADGLDADDRITAATAFAAARQWFDRAIAVSEQRPDARIYAACLKTLTAFSGYEHSSSIAALAESLSEDAFQLHAWHTSHDDPSWLGARHAEVVLWEMLSLKLKGLAGHLDSTVWWEPATVIEQHLLTAYCAGRAILKRSCGGGIEAMIRPRIEGSLIKERYQAHLLKEWLSRNAEGEWRMEAEALAARVDILMSEEARVSSHGAPIERSTVAAYLNKARIPPTVKDVIADAMSVHLENMTAAEVAIIETCIEAAWGCSDYQNNRTGRTLFHAVLAWTIRFLFSRLDLTKGVAPNIGYLFEQPDGLLPHEDKLQADYFSLMHSNVLGSEIEVSNVGGGRADLRFVFGPERLVVEVKREERDASFEALVQHYAAQTTDYQNTSVRLGFLLVLDQTEIRKSGTPHISTLVRPAKVLRDDEFEERLVVMVKVPGRRLTPSDQTKAAKSHRTTRQVVMLPNAVPA